MHSSPASPASPPPPSLPRSLDALVSPPTPFSPPAPPTPPAPTESSGQFDDATIDEDAHSLRSTSSSALSVSVALDKNGPPMPTTTEEMRSEVHRLRMSIALLEKEVAKARAKENAFTAQSAVMTRELSSIVGELGPQKAKTTRRASKRGPRHVAAAPATKGHFSAKRRRKARLAKTKVDDHTARET